MEIETFIDVLEKSIEKNGSKPLTTNYLLNILKLMNRIEDEDDSQDLIGADVDYW